MTQQSLTFAKFVSVRRETHSGFGLIFSQEFEAISLLFRMCQSCINYKEVLLYKNSTEMYNKNQVLHITGKLIKHWMKDEFKCRRWSSASVINVGTSGERVTFKK